METEILTFLDSMNPVILLLSLVLLICWTVVWKGLALWSAAREDSRAWFIALLLINTLGILEILYLFVFRKTRKGNDSSPVA